MRQDTPASGWTSLITVQFFFFFIKSGVDLLLTSNTLISEMSSALNNLSKTVRRYVISPLKTAQYLSKKSINAIKLQIMDRYYVLESFKRSTTICDDLSYHDSSNSYRTTNANKRKRKNSITFVQESFHLDIPYWKFINQKNIFGVIRVPGKEFRIYLVTETGQYADLNWLNYNTPMKFHWTILLENDCINQA